MTTDGPTPRDQHPSRSRLADERTDLAWNRCGLALVAGGLVIMRGLTLEHFSRRDVAVGAAILGLGMVSYLVAGWHSRRRLAPDRSLRAATASDLLPVAMSVTAIGLAAFVLGLLFPA